MDFTIAQHDLHEALAIVGRAVSKRSGLPILSTVLVDAGDALTLTATNLELGLTLRCAAIVASPGAMAIPAALLHEFVSAMPPAQMTMRRIAASRKVELRCARHQATIPAEDASEFPAIPQADLDAARLTVPGPVFRRLVGQVVHAASTEESRPALTGILLRAEKGCLRLAATDGYRLAVASAPIDERADFQALVPARSLTEAARLAASAVPDAPVVMEWGKGQTSLRFLFLGNGSPFQDAVLITQLIDARFPDYNPLIPKAYGTRSIVERSAFLHGVRVANLFASHAAYRTTLSVASDSLTIRAEAPEVGDQVSTIDAHIEGEAQEMKFNAHYLIDALLAIEGLQVALETGKAEKPAVLRSAANGDEFLSVIMPMGK